MVIIGHKVKPAEANRKLAGAPGRYGGKAVNTPRSSELTGWVAEMIAITIATEREARVRQEPRSAVF